MARREPERLVVVHQQGETLLDTIKTLQAMQPD